MKPDMGLTSELLLRLETLPLNAVEVYNFAPEDKENAELVNDDNIAKWHAIPVNMGRVLGGGSSVSGIDGHATTAPEFAAAAPVRAQRSSPCQCRV